MLQGYLFFFKEKFDFTFNCLYVGVWEGIYADESRSPQKTDHLDLPGTRVAMGHLIHVLGTEFKSSAGAVPSPRH